MLWNSASTSPNNKTHLARALTMDSLTGDEPRAFNLLLNDDLKAQIDSFSAKLGLSQRRFIELAVRSYLRFLANQKEASHAVPTTHQFLQKLFKNQEKRAIH